MPFDGKISKVGENRWELTGGSSSMNVPGLIYASDRMMETVRGDDSLTQVANVATLPGIVGRSIAMPDIHHGYGFAIGAVAAFDASHGVISPGGVGYDINCGVRLLRSDLRFEDVKPRLGKLIDTMFSNVPSGVGVGGRIKLSNLQMDDVLATGARWAVTSGYGWEADLEVMEENGAMAGADPDRVSVEARKRGSDQLGTLGAGNHFLEIQKVDRIFDPETARIFGITETGQVTVMIHTGSRGCGHQIATDYLEVMRRAQKKYGIVPIDPQLACAPAESPEAQQYFAAMQCGANFAWANRQLIAHWVRESFEAVLKETPEKLGMRLVSDIAHNMAKLEQHTVDGKRRHLYVHPQGRHASLRTGPPRDSGGVPVCRPARSHSGRYRVPPATCSPEPRRP